MYITIKYPENSEKLKYHKISNIQILIMFLTLSLMINQFTVILKLTIQD